MPATFVVSNSCDTRLPVAIFDSYSDSILSLSDSFSCASEPLSSHNVCLQAGAVGGYSGGTPKLPDLKYIKVRHLLLPAN